MMGGRGRTKATCISPDHGNLKELELEDTLDAIIHIQPLAEIIPQLQYNPLLVNQPTKQTSQIAYN